MKRLFILLLSIFIFIFIILVNYNKTTKLEKNKTNDKILEATSSSKTISSSNRAILIINADKVEIKTADTWQIVTGKIEIEPKTLVKTDNNGQAALVFADESKLIIDPNTTITLNSYEINGNKQNVSIFQEIGSTWSKIEKLVDADSSYEIETQTTLATVRGTTFGVMINNNQEVDYFVDEGEIKAGLIERVDGERKILSQAKIQKNELLSFNKDMVNRLKDKNYMAAPPRRITLEDKPEMKKFVENKRKLTLEKDKIIISSAEPLASESVLPTITPLPIRTQFNAPLR